MPDLSSRTRYPGTKGSNLCPLQWKHGILTSGLPGNSLYSASQLERKSPSHQGEFRNVWQCFLLSQWLEDSIFIEWLKGKNTSLSNPRWQQCPCGETPVNSWATCLLGTWLWSSQLSAKEGHWSFLGSLFDHTLASYLNHCSPSWSSWT